jgi:uncharacterized protein YbjT (DUF2867 family)
VRDAQFRADRAIRDGQVRDAQFRAGNAHLIEAAARTGAAFVLVSVIGASPGHPIGLFRAKHAAEEMLLASGIPWTIVGAAAFIETWGKIMVQPLQASGKSS